MPGHANTAMPGDIFRYNNIEDGDLYRVISRPLDTRPSSDFMLLPVENEQDPPFPYSWENFDRTMYLHRSADGNQKYLIAVYLHQIKSFDLLDEFKTMTIELGI